MMGKETFFVLVARMRAAQVEYIKSHGGKALRKAVALEAQVDEAIRCHKDRGMEPNKQRIKQ